MRDVIQVQRVSVARGSRNAARADGASGAAGFR
jgi:hypothetical protein